MASLGAELGSVDPKKKSLGVNAAAPGTLQSSPVQPGMLQSGPVHGAPGMLQSGPVHGAGLVGAGVG